MYADNSFVPTEAQMRTAISDKDRSYDGSFWYGVITTGVFCLPSCPSRRPRPENLRFFLDTWQALAAGLRPCKRCKPLEADMQRRVLIDTARYIQAHADDQMSLATLGQRANMSPTQLQKSFTAMFGVSPKALQDAARLRTFKSALRSGNRVSDAIYDAGFGSASRLYGDVLRNIGMTPSAYRTGGEGETISFACRQTSLGLLMMAAAERGVCFAAFGRSEKQLRSALEQEFPKSVTVPSSASGSKALDQWIDALNAHLTHRAPRPDVPLDLRGTAFQIMVWRFLLGVSEGRFISYSELAKGLGRTGAARAVASACAANRIAVLVPCHRVLRGDGNLAGYRWGIERKHALLAAEKIPSPH